MRRLGVIFLLAAALPATGGCYLFKQGMGQLDILLYSRPVDDMLADPAVPENVKEKLSLVQELREFGEHEMALKASNNYTTYYDTSGRPITYIVTACPKDSFHPETWWFPIVGSVPYLGFFNRDDAVAQARSLEDQGLDVSLGTAAAYSTLGYFKDPILSTMIAYPEEQLAALILHELTHGTIYLAGGAEFNEGLANFVGWQGALEFARRKYGQGSPQYSRTVEAYAREQDRDEDALALFRKLEALYRTDAPREEKLKQRETIYDGFKAERRRKLEEAREAFQERIRRGLAGDEERVTGARHLRLLEDRIPEGPLNNAVVLNQRRYGRYEEFRKRFDHAGGNWGVFFRSLVE
jgi:predicted aminopeptidase